MTLLVLCVFLKFILYSDYITVVSQPQDGGIAIPGWFNSVESFVLTVRNINSSTESPFLSSTTIINEAENDTKPRKKQTRKKRRKIVKKVIRRFRNGVPLEEIQEIHETKKKKRKGKRKNQRKFTKGEENVDSNMSASPDGKDRSQKKPVDIIVHIKVAE